MQTTANETPIRAGVFNSLAEADKAVDGLLSAGFTTGEITVVCSDKAVQAHFRTFEHQEPAGASAPTRAALGGAIGATLGGLATVAGVVATGGIALLATAGIAAWAGAAAGGLIGVMTSRGVEKELANYYDQSVAEGKIVVAAEDHGVQSAARLAEAARVLAWAGAQPMPLREG